ncbi:hypothetical protein BGX24_002636 [Mortierella sp. AD032]|nr:hypothetical protein BGX24_002636 [Mortierella sp. AD032]
MSTTAVTSESISLHPEEDKAVQQMDLDREISPAVALQRADQEMQEPHPQSPVKAEEPRSAESACEQEQTQDRDPKDATITPSQENANKQQQPQQQEQPVVKTEHSYRHGGVDETIRQTDRPDFSYQHVQSFRHDNDHRVRTHTPQQSYRYGPEQPAQQPHQQASYHYGREQDRTASQQKEQESSPSPQQPQEHLQQPLEQSSQDHQMQEESSQDNQQERESTVPVSSEPSPVIKQSPRNTPPPPFTATDDAVGAGTVDSEELPEASPSADSRADSQAMNPIAASEEHPRDVEQDTNMLSPESRPNNKRHSISDDPDPADLVDPSAEAGALGLIGAGASGSGSGGGGNGAQSDDESSGSHSRSSKIPRKVREPVRKVPKVYPPRKPRDHQGPLSTLSVPPLSPTIHASSSVSPPNHHHHDGSPSSSTGTPKIAIAPLRPAGAAGDSGSASGTAGGQAGGRGGRSSNKANIPQDAGGYRCELCPGERFGRVHDLKRHQISKHNEMTWPCDFCHRPFVRRDALLRHYAVKASRRDGVHPTTQEESRLQEAKARAKLLS